MTVLVRCDLGVSLKILSSHKEVEHAQCNRKKAGDKATKGFRKKEDNTLVKRGMETKVKLH